MELIWNVLISVVVTYCAIRLYYYYAYNYCKKRNFPHLTPKFPLGNSSTLLRKGKSFNMETVSYYDQLKKEGLKFGGVYAILRPVLVILDPDYIKDILNTDFQHFTDRGLYYNKKVDCISAHFFALDGIEWKNMRIHLTPTFTTGKIKMMFNELVRLSEHMVKAIDECIDRKVDINIREDIEDFTINFLEKTINYREKHNITRPDFLQLLLDMKKKNLITMGELTAQVFLFFVAGYDTSTATMYFALYELCRNPNIQEKLRTEINDVLKKSDGILTYDNIKDMKYLQQVIDESQRMYPPLVNLQRICVKDYKLRNSELILKKGTPVVIPIFSIHRDPDHFPDPDKFDPERFSKENKRLRHPYVHLPFGQGPRNCIVLGTRFGLMESTIGLIQILRNFRLKISPSTRMPLTLNPRSTRIESNETLYINAERITNNNFV